MPSHALHAGVLPDAHATDGSSRCILRRHGAGDPWPATRQRSAPKDSPASAPFTN